MILLLLLAQPALELELAAPDGCPDRAAFRALVAQSTPIGTGPPSLSIRVALDGPPWRAVIGERVVEGESCAAVAAAAAVIVALQLDALPPLVPPPPPPPSDPPPPEKKLRDVLRPGEDPDDPIGGAVAIPMVRIASGLALGPMPDPTMSLELSAGLLFGLLRVEVGARHLLRTAIPGASFSLVAGLTRLCLDRRWPTFGLYGCAAGEMGALFAQGRGVSDPEGARPVWLAFGAAVGATILLVGPLHLAPVLRAEFPLSRPHFTLDGAEIHRPSAWSIGADLGLEVRF